jgi:hypothetical protein
MQGHTVATHDFDISSRSFDISSDDLPGGAAPSDASAGGVWEVRRLCAGVPVYTQVCWRIARSNLELSETSLLPGVELRDAALRVSFPSGHSASFPKSSPAPSGSALGAQLSQRSAFRRQMSQIQSHEQLNLEIRSRFPRSKAAD